MTRHLGSSSQKLASVWEAFWYSKGSTLDLGVFRILFAICLLYEVGSTLWWSASAIEGGFHLPYVSFIRPVTEVTYGWIHFLQYPFTLLLAVGLFARFSCGSLLLLQGFIFFADQLNFRNHPYFFLLVLFLLLLSPADDALSIKATLRARKNRLPVIASLLGSQQPLTFQRLIQVQVCIVYLYAAFHKLNIAYLSGKVLEHYLSETSLVLALFPEPFLSRLQDFMYNPQTLIVLSVLTVVFELGLPITLWFRKTRPLAILLGIGFHLSIAFSMDIFVFSLAMMASYLLFLDPETLIARLRPVVSRDKPALR